jgi:hypothetical protein
MMGPHAAVAYRRFTMKHSLIGAVAAGIAAVAHAQPEGPNASAVAKAELVLATEEVIETLREQVAVLSGSAMNLHVPDVRAARVFADRVRVVDLAEGAPTEHGTVLDLDVRRWGWPVEAEARDVKADDLRLWSRYLDDVEFFHHAKFYTRRGSFDNSDRSRFRAESGFKGLAQLDGGDLAYVQSDLVIVWAGDAKTRGEGWKAQEIITRSFRVTETDRPFFTDVLGSALDDDDRIRARHSLRDESLIEWIVSIGSGALPLEKAVAQQLDALEDGSYPLHMSHVSVVDIDRDGHDDFYVLPSDATAMFFRNRGDGSFEEIAGALNLAHHRAEAATFADFDNDGDPDLFLSFFPGETRYLANEDGRFVDRTDRSADAFPELAVAISPMDYDGDGLLDVYFCRYNGIWLGVAAARIEAARNAGATVEPDFPGMTDEESRKLDELLFSAQAEPFVNRPGPPNRLYRNLGDGRFARATGAAAAEQYTQSMAATWSDFDLDGDMDLYVVTEAAPNQLVRNNGDGTFTDITDAATADVGFGMGLGFGDYDNDGRQDVYVTNMYSKAGLRISEQMGANEKIRGSARGNSLLRNGPDGWERVSGVTAPAILVEAADFGWGGAFADFNNDGTLDLYAPAGYVTMPPPVESVGET